MKDINIVNRVLTADEVEYINAGFDKLSLEANVALETTEKVSFVALHKNSIVGCSSGLAHKNGVNYSGWFYLTDLFVDQNFRDQGLGSDLLKALEKKIKTIGVQHIWLWTSGLPTLRFYKRHGYTPFAEMEKWYSDGSSRMGLRKTLS